MSYIGPYVLTGPDSAGGPKRNEFDRLHVDHLTDQSLGYDGQGYAWIPNVRHAPGLHFIARYSELWPEAKVRYGVVAYYL